MLRRQVNYTGMSPLQAFCCFSGSVRVVSVLQMHRLNVEIMAQISLRSRWLYVTQRGAQACSSSEWCGEAGAVESLRSLVVDVKSLIRCFYAESLSQRSRFGFRLRGVLCSPLEGLGPHSDPGSRTVTSAVLRREHGLVEMWGTSLSPA